MKQVGLDLTRADTTWKSLVLPLRFLFSAREQRLQSSFLPAVVFSDDVGRVVGLKRRRRRRIRWPDDGDCAATNPVVLVGLEPFNQGPLQVRW